VDLYPRKQKNLQLIVGAMFPLKQETQGGAFEVKTTRKLATIKETFEPTIEY